MIQRDLGDLVIRSPHYRENLCFDIVTPSGKKISPPANGWRWSKDLVENKIKDGEIVFVDNETRIVRKIFLREQQGRIPESIWFGKEVGTTRQAAQELKELFNGVAPFDTPKPTSLLEKVFQVVSLSDGDIVLDFFAGSCSTAHAVLNADHNDHEEIRFIMVQLQKSMQDGSIAREKGFRTVSQIGIERIKRVIQKIIQDNTTHLPLNGSEDLGLRVYGLDISNFKDWQLYTERYSTQLELSSLKLKLHSRSNWYSKEPTHEILLLQGFPLDSRFRPLLEYSHNHVQEVTSDFCQHRLYVCLENQIHHKTVDNLHLRPEDVFVCLDSALSDEAKITLADRVNLKVI